MNLIFPVVYDYISSRIERAIVEREIYVPVPRANRHGCMETKHVRSSWCAAHLHLQPSYLQKEAEVIFIFSYQFLITHFHSLSPFLSLLVKSTCQMVNIT